jgi:hypothetical protein
MRNALRRLELARVGLANSRDFPKERENTCRGTFYTGCDGPRESAYLEDLNRYLSIPRRLIFESSVDVGTPSLAAAPAGPDTRP